MADELMPDTKEVAAVIGSLLGFLGLLFGWSSTRKKADVDQSALVLNAWKDLFEGHQKDLKNIKEEFAEYKLSAQKQFDQYKQTTEIEMSALRERITMLEADLFQAREENLGLRRAIAQNSQSTAYHLEATRGSTPTSMTDELEKLDRAGGNSVPGAKGK